MLRDISASAVSAGLLAAAVGFASSFAVVLEGLTAAGASPAEAASGLMALSVAMGVAGVVLSARTRMPVSIAWSTPGAALLATTGSVAGGYPAAVGAFSSPAPRCSSSLGCGGPWGVGSRRSRPRSPTRCSPGCCSACASRRCAQWRSGRSSPCP